MDTSRYFPFLDKAPLIRKGVNVFQTSDIIIMSGSDINSSKEINIKPRYNAFLIYPIGKLILEASPEEVYKLMTTNQYVTCNYQEVDYTKVACVLDINTLDNTTYADYPLLNGVLREEISPNSIPIINMCIGSYKVTYAKTYNIAETTSATGRKIHSINESVSLSDLSKVTDSSNLEINSEDSPYKQRLESYFKGNYTTNRTPLLVGGTAVAKSAIVKSLAVEHNMRMVDIRTAFITRFDIEGLSEKVETPEGVESFSCPMDSMVACTDAYIEYCKKAVERINDKIKELTKENTQESKDNINYLTMNILPKFIEGSKVPVLFFDEITRGEKSVRQALTKILTDKAFMGYSMSKARFVAATNSSGKDDDRFATVDVEDSAFFDRFESMFITVDDAFPNWVQWANSFSESKGRTNIHPDIMKYIRGKVSNAYDESEILANYENTGDTLELNSSPFPNFRTWELVSDYMYSNEESKEINYKYIEGLIGPEATNRLSRTLKISGWLEKPDNVKDKMLTPIEEGLSSNIPTMLIAPSSVGKTARIKKKVLDEGAVFLEINLAEQDRTDLLGFPAKVSINKLILGNEDALPEDLRDVLLEDISLFKLPPSVTVKAPKSAVVNKFKEAYSSGKKVVIFFDELNRVMHPSTMSAVFDCCSDHRIFGVDFDPSRVSVFAACNLGDNMGDAQPLDPAFTARFSIYKKNSYDEDDARAFINYAESAEFNPALLAFLKQLSTTELLSFISSVETRTLEVSASSTRGIEDLSRFLNDEENNSIMSGAFIFPDRISQINCNNMLNSDRLSETDYTTLFNTIDTHIDNWVGLKSKLTIKLNLGSRDEILSGGDIYKLYKDFTSTTEPYTEERGKTLATITKLILMMESNVLKSRNKMTSIFLGDNSVYFNNFYNQISGREVKFLTIKDIISLKKVAPYITQVLSKCKKVTDTVDIGIDIIRSIYNEYQNTLPQENLRLAFSTIIDKTVSTDMKFSFIRKVTSSYELDSLLKQAEGGDFKYISRLLSDIGFNYTEDKLKNLVTDVTTVKEPVIL